MSEPQVIVEQRGSVAIVTLNQPARKNALSSRMLTELVETWPRLDADETVRVVVLTGAGEGFCTGADMKDAAEQGGLAGPDPESVGEGSPALTPRMARMYKPVIVAVNGTCAGGGLHFVVDSDIVIASDRAVFTDPHVTVGQVSALEPIGLCRKIPVEAVLRMVVMGRHERIDAQRALALGMVSEVVPHDQLMARALELAELVATNSPAATRRSLEAIWRSFDVGLEEGLRRGMDSLEEHWKHPDAAEGPRAFAERRAPQWAP